MKRVLCTVLSFLLAIGCVLTSAVAADPEARTIVIFRLDGKDIKMTKGTSKRYTAKESYRLYEGYTLSTGKASYSYLKLDEESLVKMDQKSEISISKVSKKKISISLKSGAIMVDAANQTEGSTLETSVGGSALTIRGTKYIIEYKKLDGYIEEVVITMLEGRGDVDGIPLDAGQTMHLHDIVKFSPGDPVLPGGIGKPERVYKLEKTVISEKMSIFTLTILLEYRDFLIETGVFTEKEIELIPPLLENRSSEEDVDPPDIKNVVIYSDDPTDIIPPITPPSGVGTYTELMAALLAAVSGDTVTINGTFTIPTGNTLSVPAGVTLEVAPGAAVTNDGTMTLAAGAVLNVQSGGSFINNSNYTLNVYGTLTINGTLQNTSTGALYCSNGGQITVNGDLISDGAITVSQGCLLVLNSGSFTASGPAFHNAGEMRFLGGSVNVTATINSTYSGARFVYGSGVTISAWPITGFYDSLASQISAATYLIGKVFLCDGSGWNQVSTIPISSSSELAMIGGANPIYSLFNNYVLTNNIGTGGPSDAPVSAVVGDSTNPFVGTFDGAGYTVTLAINQATDHAGIFGVVGSLGSVTNLSVTGSITGGSYTGSIAGENCGAISNCHSTATVTSTGSTSTGGIAGYNIGVLADCTYSVGVVSGQSRVGGIAGYNVGGTVSNCDNTGGISGTVEYVGGIVGENAILLSTLTAGTVTDCTNSGNVTGGNIAGGIVGENIGCIVYNCENVSGTVTGVNYIGGIVGRNLADGSYMSTVENCASSATVTATGNRVGGIAGANYLGSELTSCSNNGNVDGVSRAGGIVGENGGDAANGGIVANCDNYGNVTGTGEEIGGVAGCNYIGILRFCSSDSSCTVLGGNEVGGIAGYSGNAASEVTGCMSEATVTGTGYQVGGIVGYSSGGMVINCGYDGAVSGTSQVGGVVGYSVAASIAECDSAGTVDGTGDDVGGITGQASNSTVNSCVSVCAVTGSGANVGGIAGYCTNSAAIDRCMNTGAVSNIGSGTSFTGGIVGRFYGDVVQRCVNTGDVSGNGDVGGIAGTNGNSIGLRHCNNTGNINGTDNVGGIVGNNASAVSYCLSSGIITSADVAGGIVGYNAVSVVINCVVTGGSVNGSLSYTGRIIGDPNAGGNYNYALDTVQVNGSNVLTGAINNENGATIDGLTYSLNAAFFALAANWESGIVWDGTIWDFTVMPPKLSFASTP